MEPNTVTVPPSTRAIWLREAKWGLMFHYIDGMASSSANTVTTPTEWNRRVDSFNVPRFARKVRASGASYVIFTLGQNTGHYCSPNPVYDELTGLQPSRLSHRDLVAEIATALAPDVKLITYLPSHAPALQQEAIHALRFLPPWDASACGITKFWPDSSNVDERLTTFQRNWESVVAHWGTRWGHMVAGWWIDGCYFVDRIYKQNPGTTSDSSFPGELSFAAALRTGNSDRVLAFNSGTNHPFERVLADQDYTAGEFSEPSSITSLPPAVINGLQTHLLSYLAEWWGKGEPRFSDQFVQSYTHQVTQNGAAMTWDIPITKDGDIPDAFLRQLDHLTKSTG